MREAELLNALAQAPGGISIDICPDGRCTVSTYYEPHVLGTGKNLMRAAYECAQCLLTYSDAKTLIPDVLLALAAYDKHSERLSL
jgi:hypothetical protein